MRKFIGYLLGYEQRIQEMDQRFDQLIDHVDRHAVFKDDNGLSMGNYNREQIAEHWRVFHDLAWTRLRKIKGNIVCPEIFNFNYQGKKKA